MEEWLLEILRCPRCGGELTLQAVCQRAADGRVQEGCVACQRCDSAYPVRCGIVRFVPSERYVESFGLQWTRYRVEEAEEDRNTFVAKTGFQLDELRGLTVLDAGCGAGRYSRVAAEAGARVVAVDMSRAVDQAARLCRDLANVQFIQADLLELPLAVGWADAAFSIGVLHHTSRPAEAFRQVARTVRPGGKLAVWVYRRNSWLQESVNTVLRGITTRTRPQRLESLAELGAAVGTVPVLNCVLNKLVNFSNHPRWVNRVCDTFDWYSPKYQFHHTEAEVLGWFRSAGFEQLRLLPPEKSGRLYLWAYRHNLIIGSGVNVVGVKGVEG